MIRLKMQHVLKPITNRRSLILKITPIREHVPILPCAGHTVFPEKGVAVVMRKGRLEEEKEEGSDSDSEEEEDDPFPAIDVSFCAIVSLTLLRYHIFHFHVR